MGGRKTVTEKNHVEGGREKKRREETKAVSPAHFLQLQICFREHVISIPITALNASLNLLDNRFLWIPLQLISGLNQVRANESAPW